MTQIFFPYTAQAPKQTKTYCYVNNSTQVVIAKINSLENRQCERVVFPAEKFLFTAESDCELEIYQHTNVGMIRDTIACHQLQVISE